MFDMSCVQHDAHVYGDRDQHVKEIRYMIERKRYDEADGHTLIAKFIYNLSNNREIDFSQQDGNAIDKSFTYDGIIQGIEADALNEKERLKLTSMYSEALIETFARGETSADVSIRCMPGKNIPPWIGINVKLREDPENEGIVAFVFVRDKSKEHLEQLMLARLTTLGFDAVGYIDLIDSTATYYVYPQEADGVSEAVHIPYDERLITSFSDGMTKAQREFLFSQTTLSHIENELAKEERWQCIFEKREADGSNSMKRIDYCYLDREKHSIIYVISDVTKEFEKDHKHMKEMEDASRLQASMLAQLNHDIRTPIGIIRSMASFAKEDVGDTEKLKKDLASIEAGSEMLLSLISNLNDITNIYQGEITLHPDVLDYEHNMSIIYNVLSPLCQQKGIDFEMRRHIQKCKAVLDHNRLGQIQLNLVKNAVRYTGRGGRVIFDMDVEPDQHDRARVVFTVCDNGIGMSKEFQKCMFEPFTEERNNPNRTSDMEGTGLGLSIVKRNIDLMGGTIDVKSDIGKGTSITVTIPAEKRGLDMPDSHEHKPIAQENGLRGRVLVAEDNEINRAIITRTLESYGISAAVARNGKEAVHMFESSSPGTYKAILMDIMMPVMDGFEATRRIRTGVRPDGKDVPIIALTANAMMTAAKTGRKAGMNRYLTKPVDKEKLYIALSEYLDSRN
ncbi:MAG: ATP-binding protein [Veillonellaceae bacterium]|nr:ATP-binding protein [Veillonellaceae bacterium]MDD6923475.1 ATP-binding protein [Veillonellaceae bacterium]